MFLWGLGIGDWGLGPIPNPQSPNTKINFHFNINKNIILEIFNHILLKINNYI